MNNDVCNGLRIVPLTPDYPYLDSIFDMRDEAFPKNERPTTREVSPFTEENGYVTLAFEDDNVPIGFMQLYRCEENVYFGLYLAIGKEFRNKHYGTRVLNMVIEEYLKDTMMFGCVEALIPEAENYQQRLDRIRFYQRNGMFVLDGVFDAEPFGKYQFVCTKPNVTFEQLKAKISPVIASFVNNRNNH